MITMFDTDDDTMMADVRCQNCSVWDEDSGTCRSNAPRLVDEDMGAIWPCTRPDDWCGDFVPAPDEETAKKMAQYIKDLTEGGVEH